MECILSPHDIINQSDYNVPVIIFGFPGISDIHCNQFLLKKSVASYGTPQICMLFCTNAILPFT